MRINKLDIETLNNFLKIDLLNFANINHKNLRWVKKYIDKRHSSYSKKHHKNYYETKNYYMSKSDIQYSSVIHNVKDGDTKNSVSVILLESKNAFRKFQISISGSASYMLEQFRDILEFEEKSKYLNVIQNYYKILLHNNKSKYDNEHGRISYINGSIDIQFTLCDKNWCIDHIKTHEYITDNLSQRAISYLSHGYQRHLYKGLFFVDDFGYSPVVEIPTQGLILSHVDKNIHSSKLDSLNKKFEDDINFHEYLHETDIEEALTFMDLVNY